MSAAHSNPGGFTFLEVMAVMVVMAIVSAVVYAGMGSENLDLPAQAEVVKSHLRYAQSQAINSYAVFGVRCDGSEYWLFQGTDPNSNIRQLPDEPAVDTDADQRLDLAAKKIDLTVFTLFFDARGVPYTAYTDETTNTPLPSAGLVITATPDGLAAPSQTITVTQLTGYVP